MRFGFVGGGTMAEALISALLKAGLAAPEEITVGEPLPERRQTLAESYRVVVTADNQEAAAGADTIVVATKPYQFAAVAAELRGHLKAEQTAVSIMAGVTLAKLRESLGHDAVVRVMPNTPAQIGEGMSAWCAGPAVDEAARERVRRMLRAAGREVYFEDERCIDMATAVSGSGPGFVFLLMEAFSDGASKLGISPETARELVVQTFLGAARLAQQSDHTLAELRALVTTPGGTTAEGLRVLEEAGLRDTVREALAAAYERSQAIGKG